MSPSETTRKPMPDFDSLADHFLRMGALGSPAECHGLLCGHLCAGARLALPAWLQLVQQQLELQESVDEAAQQCLDQLYQVSLVQLSSAGFEFEPLVPDSDQPLELRAKALGEWCQGFLAGFGLANTCDLQHCSDEFRGALEDFAQIAQIVEDAQDSEENEADLMEVFEYVRMATLLIFGEINQAEPGDAAPQVLH